MNSYKMIAMIPARMGSRRIPYKNIRYMLDKPLIQYPIDFAKNSGFFDSIWVNTESEELGTLCQQLGINFHRRPVELSSDTATNRDFTYEFLKTHNCDYVIMMNPTSPALRQETVNNFLHYVAKNSFDTVMSVCSIQAEAFCNDKYVNFTGLDKIPSEQLPPVEYIVWAMTAWKRDTFISLQESGKCPIFGGNLGRFVIPKDECADLDTEEDWRIAEASLLARSAAAQEPQYLFQ